MKHLSIVLAATVLHSGNLELHSPSVSRIFLADLMEGVGDAAELAATRDGRHIYYADANGCLWFADRTNASRPLQIAAGGVRDVTVSAVGNVLAFTRPAGSAAGRHIYVITLDPISGLATAPEQTIDGATGDKPAISPRGDWLAFARDARSGVDQAIEVLSLPITRGSRRAIISEIGAPVGSIRWSPDSRLIYVASTPPVPCHPEWSCFPQKSSTRSSNAAIWRLAFQRENGPRSQRTLVVRATRDGWPGLSPDGKWLVYADTGRGRHYVVADARGRVVERFALEIGQQVVGWFTDATLVFAPAVRR
jgi:dipeptidyl aminopeptidase/acylaminoacyl peptidase